MPRKKTREWLQLPSTYLLANDEVLEKGLRFLGRTHSVRASYKTREESFKRLFGSSPRALAEQWYDLTRTEIPEATLDPRDISEEGFCKFMKAHNWVWDYPKNAETFGVRWNQCERNSRGAPVWDFIKKIAALKSTVIVWEADMDREDTAIFILTNDDVDFGIREPASDELNKDPAMCSQKINHAALKYEIAISLLTGLCVWTNGPFPASTNDKTIFDQGLSMKMKPGKLGIADGGFIGREQQLSITNIRDRPDVRMYKRRARMRHETFNGRLKCFGSLCQIFHHHKSTHSFVFDMVCVTVQYQLKCGSPLFVV
jgi:hypothetical protein